MTVKELTQTTCRAYHNSNNCFSDAYLNCRNLLHKLPDIGLIYYWYIDVNAIVLAVTETWLSSDLESAVTISGFSVVHKFEVALGVEVFDILFREFT